MQIIIIYKYPQKFIIIKKKLKKLGHFFLRREIQKLSQLLGTGKFHHLVTMRLILIPFKHLRKNHTNLNHLYSSPSNYTYPYTSISIYANHNHLYLSPSNTYHLSYLSISIHTNYNNLYAPSQIYNYKKNLKKLGHLF